MPRVRFAVHAPPCGARCRDGHACRAPAVMVRVDGELVPRNGRCVLHGGRSTGPRTPEGRERAERALARINAERIARKLAREQEAASHA